MLVTHSKDFKYAVDYNLENMTNFTQCISLKYFNIISAI